MRLIEKFFESIKVLNDYRNLYHAESSSTEQYKVANAINDILPEFCRLIESDTEPVVHAHWIDKCVRDWHCSNCGGTIQKVRIVDGYCNEDLPKFCPDCGAKMDEEAK